MIRLSGGGSSSKKETQDFIWSGLGDRTFNHSLGVIPDFVTLTFLSTDGVNPQFLGNGGQLPDHFWHTQVTASWGYVVKAKSSTQVVITTFNWWQGTGNMNLRLIMAVF